MPVDPGNTFSDAATVKIVDTVRKVRDLVRQGDRRTASRGGVIGSGDYITFIRVTDDAPVDHSGVDHYTAQILDHTAATNNDEDLFQVWAIGCNTGVIGPGNYLAKMIGSLTLDNRPIFRLVGDGPVQGGDGDPAHVAPQGTFYFDHTSNALWINHDGSTGWNSLYHPLLNGEVHSDTEAATVVKGSLIVGNATPKWDALPVGTNTHVLTADSSETLGVKWAEAPGSSSTNALLDGTNHTDTAAGTVVRGDVIVGNADPAWERRAIGAANTCLRSDGTDTVYDDGDLDNNARVGVRKNSTGSTFERRRLNLIEGSGVTLTVADDSVSEEVDVTIAASGGGGGVTSVEEVDGTPSLTGIHTLRFDQDDGFVVSEPESGVARIDLPRLIVEEQDGSPSFTGIHTLQFHPRGQVVTQPSAGVALVGNLFNGVWLNLSTAEGAIQTISDNTEEVIVFQGAANVGGYTVNSDGTVEVPQPGMYLITCGVCWEANDTGTREVSIHLDVASFFVSVFRDTKDVSVANSHGQTVSGVFFLSTSTQSQSTVAFRCRQTSGGDLDILNSVGGGGFTYASVVWLGPTS